MLNQKDFQNYKALKTTQLQHGNNPEILAMVGFSRAKLTRAENKLRRYLDTIPDEIRRDAMRNYIFSGMTPYEAARYAVHSRTPGASSRSVHSFVLSEIGIAAKSGTSGSRKRKLTASEKQQIRARLDRIEGKK